MSARRALREILALPSVEAAPRLIGCRLMTQSEDGNAEVELVEVEAYGGSEDPASHAFRGLTERNRSMFEGPGHLYVYRSYGIHWCANISTGPADIGQAVLLRAGVPTKGRELMEDRRGRTGDLTNGPGKLTQALAISREDDGLDVLGTGRVRLSPGERRQVAASPRIGITKAQNRAWRFVAVTG